MFVFLVISILLNASANIFLKMAANRGIDLTNQSIPFLIKNNVTAIVGIFLFGLSAFSYFAVLRKLSVTTAYPTIVLSSFILINIFAYFILDERINIWQFFGYILIACGIIMVFNFNK
ncbi:hypothetical protein FJ364_01585 [Candidatus Dependentiae bacterium]|nr:hypothetical protein [Candidatus Dependentiae bacterium]